MPRRPLILIVLASVVLMSMSVTAGAAGQPPEAREDRYTVKAGRQLVVSAADGLLANDSDPEGDKLTAHLSFQRPPGKLSLRPDGSFRYTPISTGGNDFFSYTAFDGQTHSSPTFVIIRVDAVPSTQPDSYGVIAPSPRTIAAPGVLGNDFDVNGDILRTELVKKTSHGQLTLRSDGGFTYTPGKTPRDDYFTYRALDDTQRSAITRVDLRVVIANAPPVAVDDTYVIQENSPASVPPPGVLANDTDPNGDTLTAEVLFGGIEDLEFNPDGSFFYQPPLNWDTDVTFRYRVTDGITFSAAATVTIDIVAVNNPPTGEADFYEMDHTTGTLVVAAPGVLENDFDDVEFDSVHVHGVVTQPAHGDLTLNSNGSFTYTPDPGFIGTDGFTYRPADSSPGNVTSVTIEVT